MAKPAQFGFHGDGFARLVRQKRGSGAPQKPSEGGSRRTRDVITPHPHPPANAETLWHISSMRDEDEAKGDGAGQETAGGKWSHTRLSCCIFIYRIKHGTK